MAACQFEEKEYEVAADIELARSGHVFGAGQVVEAVLGYDAVAAPTRDHLIWRVLGVPRPPGVRLIPAHWQPGSRPSAAALPSVLVSLIIQYKRPDYLYGATARQWRMWNEPYFRFARTTRQHTILGRLERRLSTDALVRYAAPAFWRRGELEAAQLDGRVLLESGFVRPSDIGDHRVWTYIAPGSVGLPNPRGRAARFETFEDVLASVRIGPLLDVGQTDLVVREPGLSEHLSKVGAAAVDRTPKLRRRIDEWVWTLQDRDLGISEMQIQMLANVAAIVTTTDTMNASWHLVAT
jgi:hypothetical protein